MAANPRVGEIDAIRSTWIADALANEARQVANDHRIFFGGNS